MFFLSMMTFGLSYGLYKGIIDNYLAEIVSMTSFDKGVSEFFRELPGLMLVLVLAALYSFSAERIYRIGAAIMLAGMALQTITPPSRALVTGVIFLYSLGEHMQIGMRNAMSLNYAQEGRGGRALGAQNATYQIGTLIGFVVVFAIFLRASGSASIYRAIFGVSAAFIALSALANLKLKGVSATDPSASRFFFRRKYKKYYT